MAARFESENWGGKKSDKLVATSAFPASLSPYSTDIGSAEAKLMFNDQWCKLKIDQTETYY